MKLAVTIHVLNNHTQYFEHFANKIEWLLEQSSQFLLPENLNALSASQKVGSLKPVSSHTLIAQS